MSPGGTGGGVGSNRWDPSTIETLYTSGPMVTASNSTNGELRIEHGNASGPIAGDFAVAFLSTDRTETMLVYGRVNNNGSIDTALSIARASDNSSWFSNGSCDSSSSSQFWSDYWHYLTHPWDMDDDLETGFYVAVGTAAVAGTAAATIVVVEAVIVTEVGVAAAGTGGAASAGGGGVLLGAEAEIAAAHAQIVAAQASIANIELAVAESGLAMSEVGLAGDAILVLEAKIASHWAYIDFMLTLL